MNKKLVSMALAATMIVGAGLSVSAEGAKTVGT